MKEHIKFQDTGICKIDVNGVIRKFTLLNRIFQYGEEFYLLEYTPKCKRKLKIRISEEDARNIINELQLKPFIDNFFKRATTYVPVA